MYVIIKQRLILKRCIMALIRGNTADVIESNLFSLSKHRLRPAASLACRDKMAVFGRKKGPLLQQVWHVKDPSLLKDRQQMPTFCSPVTCSYQ